MEKLLFGFLLAVLVPALPVSAREVVFIGLTGESAPGMQAHFSRTLEERLESAAGIRVVNNQETERLRMQIGSLSYPTLTASLASSLRRCAGDSAFLMWGMVKEFSVKILRKQLVKKQVGAQLKIELAIYDPMTQSYSYLGEVATSVVVDKGFTVEFGDLNETGQVPAMDRERLLDTLQTLVAERSAAILVKSVLTGRPPADTAKAKSAAPSGTTAPPEANVPVVRDSSLARSSSPGGR